MSNAALMIPGCVCCAKAGECVCEDLDLSKAIGLKVEVKPDIIDMKETRGADPFNYSRHYWTEKPQQWVREWDDYGTSPGVSLGGGPGCGYKLRFTVDCKIDRGTYSTNSKIQGITCWSLKPYDSEHQKHWTWPAYIVGCWPAEHPGGCAAFGNMWNAVVAWSTGENMPLSWKSYLDGDGNAKVIDVPPADWPNPGDQKYIKGPVKVHLGYHAMRFSAGFFAVIKNIECLQAVILS